uniref:Uncharacterized protein n=1 Tax=Molossus molossus TaxID=27622 RepID=A0A7J8CRG1_MOLMO|nr:hypothetical protein HJG59_009725 [Molossus molossus]
MQSCSGEMSPDHPTGRASKCTSWPSRLVFLRISLSLSAHRRQDAPSASGWRDSRQVARSCLGAAAGGQPRGSSSCLTAQSWGCGCLPDTGLASGAGADGTQPLLSWRERPGASTACVRPDALRSRGVRGGTSPCERGLTVPSVAAGLPRRLQLHRQPCHRLLPSQAMVLGKTAVEKNCGFSRNICPGCSGWPGIPETQPCATKCGNPRAQAAETHPHTWRVRLFGELCPLLSL